MVTLRDAIIADLPGIVHIYNHAILTTTATFDLEEQTLAQRQEWFSHYGGRFPLVVAVIEEEIVGYACLSPFRNKPTYANSTEHSIYVAHNQYGQGIGKLLMIEILKRAEELNYHTIIGGITAGNDVSVKLHEKFGFTLVGHLKQVGYKFDRWQDVLFYQKML